MNKKAIELSINFLVVLIISIAVFGYGVIFVYNIATGADSLSKMTIDDLDAQISDLKCGRTERVCFDKDSITLPPKEFEVITLKVLNVGENEQSFTIETTATKFIDKDGNEQGVSLSDHLVILPGLREENIPLNEQKALGIGFETTREARSGTYVIDVNILKDNSGYDDITHKLYVNVP